VTMAPSRSISSGASVDASVGVALIYLLLKKELLALAQQALQPQKA